MAIDSLNTMLKASIKKETSSSEDELPDITAMKTSNQQDTGDISYDEVA